MSLTPFVRATLVPRSDGARLAFTSADDAVSHAAVSVVNASRAPYDLRRHEDAPRDASSGVVRSQARAVHGRRVRAIDG
jgi:hypothetical protein